MKIFFRCDGNSKVGLGHLIRCLSIANQVKKTAAMQRLSLEITFLIQNDPVATTTIERYGYKVIHKSEETTEEDFLLSNANQADVLLIDRLYQYSGVFVLRLKKSIRVLMLHNICDGSFEANLSVLPAAHISNDIIEDPRWNQGLNSLLHGPEYIVLNEKILNLSKPREVTAPLNIYVTAGGSDPKGVTLSVIKWLINNDMNKGIRIKILIGSAFQQVEKLERVQKKLPSYIEILPFDADQLIHADMAICTFGITTYELMYLGIPTLCIGHSTQNARGSSILEKRYGATVDLGVIDQLDEQYFIEKVRYYIGNEEARESLAGKGKQIVTGKGAVKISTLLIQLYRGIENR